LVRMRVVHREPPSVQSRSSDRDGVASSLLGLVGLATLIPLLLWDLWPRLFPATAHAVLAPIPLSTIAIVYLLHHRLRRAGRAEIGRATLLAVAFLFWAANQYWSDRPVSTLFNDIAIAAFVLDLVLAMVQSSSSSSPLCPDAAASSPDAAAVPDSPGRTGLADGG
jgi:uncharacterized membrane protein YfcA